MDREVIEQKLESLRRCLHRIETKCPADARTLVADIDLQDIVALNLSRAVQICVDIGSQSGNVRLKAIVHFESR